MQTNLFCTVERNLKYQQAAAHRQVPLEFLRQLPILPLQGLFVTTQAPSQVLLQLLLPAIIFFISVLLNLPCMLARLIFLVCIFRHLNSFSRFRYKYSIKKLFTINEYIYLEFSDSNTSFNLSFNNSSLFPSCLYIIIPSLSINIFTGIGITPKIWPRSLLVPTPCST